MILSETLRRVIRMQAAELGQKPTGIPRTAADQVDLSLPHALTIAGVRRCGKSTLLRQLMTSNCTYCNFEDPNLIAFSVRDFEKLENVFNEICPGFRICMFDEIQNVPEWERYVGYAKHKFIITGSNASLLSRELGTRLTGRHLNLELMPFSYDEMLEYTRQKPGLESYRHYAREGGFPEYLHYRRSEILQELFKDILLRDIAVRHGVRDVQSLQELAQYLISNVGKEFSFNRLAELFTFGSNNTISGYISHMEESYLLFTVPRFSFSLKQQRRNPRKIYGIDTGFCRANSAAFSANEGQMLENAVFLELRRRRGDIYYFKGHRECDFVVKQGGEIISALQVCLRLHEENIQREIEGLHEAMAATGCSSGLILTMDQEDRIDDIRVKPAWKWATNR